MQAGQASQMIINTESKASESHHAQAQKYPISIHTSSTTVFSRSRGPFSSPFRLKCTSRTCVSLHNETSSDELQVHQTMREANYPIINIKETG